MGIPHEKHLIKKLIGNKIHFIAWSLFIVYETLVIGLVYNIFGNPFTYLLHYAVIISFFYLLCEYLLPWSVNTKVSRWWRLPVALSIYLFGYIFFHYLADLLLIHTGAIVDEGKNPLNYQFVLKNIYRGLYFMGFSCGYFLIKERFKVRREQEILRQEHLNNIIEHQRTEQELSDTQNAYLKSQINPHFLFNTLDFIYHNIKGSPEIASEGIIHLSRLMRYAIDSDKQGKFINLGEELKHVETLLHLYRMRKNDNFNLKFEYGKETKHLTFIPLVLLTITENVLKHGDFSNRDHGACIRLYTDRENFYIESTNRTGNHSRSISSGKGIKNIHQRLIYAYGTDIVFQSNTDLLNQYSLNIRIPLKEIQKNSV
ncbi:MAG: histidine kinase [Chryseobacterium sp.]|nr:MAG: histidine kinase [Chryseobacterium sp.]